MWKFKGDDALGFQKYPQSLYKIVDIWDLSEDVVADEQVRLLISLHQPPRTRDPKELDKSGDTLFDGGAGDIAGRLDPERRDAFRREVFQEIAVIAGHFHDLAGLVEAKARHDHVGVCS